MSSDNSDGKSRRTYNDFTPPRANRTEAAARLGMPTHSFRGFQIRGWRALGGASLETAPASYVAADGSRRSEDTYAATDVETIRSWKPPPRPPTEKPSPMETSCSTCRGSSKTLPFRSGNPPSPSASGRVVCLLGNRLVCERTDVARTRRWKANDCYRRSHFEPVLGFERGTDWDGAYRLISFPLPTVRLTARDARAVLRLDLRLRQLRRRVRGTAFTGRALPLR
jgi:hypothetical protein